MKPMLVRGGLSGRIYVVTRYKDLGDGRYESILKYDVTDQFEELRKEMNAREAVAGVRQLQEQAAGVESGHKEQSG